MKSPDFFNFDYLKNYVRSLMPKPPINYMVRGEQQQREIESLKQTVGGRRFFFVNNLENFETEHAHGVSKWLGYSEKEFTMKWYLDHVVHPGKRSSVILVAVQLYNALCTGIYPLNFMVQRYSSLVALKHRNGNYLLANKISSVFQYDTDNRLTAYLNEFTIIGDYDGQPLGPDFFLEDGRPDERGKQILEATINHFIELKMFAPKELQMARLMIYNPTFTKAQVADAMGVMDSTIKELGKRLKEKADDLFHRKFDSVAEIVLFLKKECLL